jgi:hypothetical protein
VFSRWWLIVAFALVGVIAVSGTIVAVRLPAFISAAHTPTATGAPTTPKRVRVALQDPVLQRSVRTIEVGAVRSTLAKKGFSASAVVGLQTSAAGVAFVRNAAGRVVASAPVWHEPGVTSGVPAVTCETTAFDRVLLTPGFGVYLPVEVDLLWSVSNRAPVRASLRTFGARLCEVERTKGVSAAETDAGVSSDEHAYVGALFAQLEALHTRAAHLTAVIGPVSPTIQLASSVVRTGAEGECGEGTTLLPPDRTSKTGLTLCSSPTLVHATNRSPIWQFVFPRRSAVPWYNPVLAVSPQRVAIPTIEELVLDLTKDTAQNLCHEVAPDLCTATGDSLQKALNLREPGADTASPADGYVSIGFGEGSTPTGLPLSAADVTKVQTESYVFTVVTQELLPVVWMVLDSKPDEPGEQTVGDLTREVWHSLSDGTFTMPVSSPRTMGDWVANLQNIVDKLLKNPELFDMVLGVVAPTLAKTVLPKLTIKIAEYVTGLAIPGVDALMAAKFAMDKATEMLNLALSIRALSDSGILYHSVAVWPSTKDPTIDVAGCPSREMDGPQEYTPFTASPSTITLPFDRTFTQPAVAWQTRSSWGGTFAALAPADSSCMSVDGPDLDNQFTILDAGGHGRLQGNYAHADGPPYACMYLPDLRNARVFGEYTCDETRDRVLKTVSLAGGRVRAVLTQDANPANAFNGPTGTDRSLGLVLVYLPTMTAGRFRDTWAATAHCPVFAGQEAYCADALALFAQQDLKELQAQFPNDKQVISGSVSPADLARRVHGVIAEALPG